jgi:hypothetical protein
LSVCSNCSETIDKQRLHLGYTECLDCSQIEHYSAHTVYPHKTGGYVQPVSKTTSNNLKRIDRRSVGRTRVGKSSGDWDKWLEKYYHDLYNPKPEKDVCTITHITEDKLYNNTILYYKENGYQLTIEWLKQLFNDDKISLGSKSKMLDEINRLELLPKRLRKWSMKIQ